MRVSEDRYMRDLRRIHLAQRMIRHEVRTITIRAWTGFNEERIRNLARSYAANLRPANRHRGPPPKRIEVLMRQAQLRNEVVALAGLARVLGIVPPERIANAARALPELALGERLCHAFELYRQVVPEGRLTLQHFILVVMALAEAVDIELDHCSGCNCVVLVQPGMRERRICAACKALEGQPRLADQTNGDEEQSEPVPPTEFQKPLF